MKDEIIQLKAVDILLGSTSDSRNNSDEPTEINSSKPLIILIINIPINWYFLFLSKDLNRKYDINSWIYSKKGYFKFKQNIPEILKNL